MSISTGAVSELSISQINLPQELSAAAVLFTFNPQPTQFLLPVGLTADAVKFIVGGEPVAVPFPPPPKSVVQIDFPEFDAQSAWTIDFGDPVIDYAGFSPRLGAFLVRYVDGNFTLWLHMPQGVMRGLVLAPRKLLFLHNLGPPFLASFLP